jgi:predicted transcriptional regulator
MFADFTRMQRKLLAALQGGRFLTLPAVMKAVYGTDAKETSALEQLVTRTNQALTTKNLGLEIKRKSNTWSLQQL